MASLYFCIRTNLLNYIITNEQLTKIYHEKDYDILMSVVNSNNRICR